MRIDIITGDCRQLLKQMPDQSVHCCVTSPPYFGLRDYGHEGQIGLEQTPDDYVAEMVAVFREVRRVLRDDGTLWLNLGDSYCGAGYSNNKNTGGAERKDGGKQLHTKVFGLRSKDLIGIPWRVAFAMQADGWYLRQDIIWHKPNPMPESVRDRCTKAHEYIFLFSKSPKYYFDQEAILEPITDTTAMRMLQDIENQKGSDRVPFKTNGAMKAVARKAGNKTHKYVAEYNSSDSDVLRTKSGLLNCAETVWEKRNRRSVWTVATKPFKGAHFATYPPELIEPCIKAGCPEGGTVLDPFFGAGTTGIVASRLGRNCIGCELNPEYAALAKKRIFDDGGMFSGLENSGE